MVVLVFLVTFFPLELIQLRASEIPSRPTVRASSTRETPGVDVQLFGSPDGKGRAECEIRASQ